MVVWLQVEQKRSHELHTSEDPEGVELLDVCDIAHTQNDDECYNAAQIPEEFET
jgi:hypothetical protein